MARALVRVKSSSPVKQSFRFWSLAGELLKCRQKYFNTVMSKSCSSRLFFISCPNSMYQLGFCSVEVGLDLQFFETPEPGFLLPARSFSFQQLIQILLLCYHELRCVYIVFVFHKQTTPRFPVRAS